MKPVPLVVLLLAVSAAPLLAGGNQLSNGSFSSFTTSPWTGDSFGKIYLSNLDFQNDADSGSALVVDDNLSSLYATVMRSECVRISGGEPVDLGGQFKAGTKRPAGSKMRVRGQFYSDTNCTTGVSVPSPSFFDVPTGWTLKTVQYTSPSTARAVKFEVAVMSGTIDNLEVLADGLYLNAAGGTSPSPLFANGFESGDASGWGIVD